MTFVGFVDAYAAEKESSLFPLGMSQNTEISPKEEEACLTQEEWKVIRDKDPKAYEERQKQFQTDILNFYSAEKCSYTKRSDDVAIARILCYSKSIWFPI